MPLLGAIPEGPAFFCPHCGALYSVTRSRLSAKESNIAKCVVCGKIMDEWDSRDVPTFSLFIALTMPDQLRERAGVFLLSSLFAKRIEYCLSATENSKAPNGMERGQNHEKRTPTEIEASRYCWQLALNTDPPVTKRL